jgi:hypothetical protein
MRKRDSQQGSIIRNAIFVIILVIFVGIVASTGIRPAFVAIFGGSSLNDPNIAIIDRSGGAVLPGGGTVISNPSTAQVGGPSWVRPTAPTGGTATTSAWQGGIRISTGNSGYETAPDKEYISIQNSSAYDAVLTGWKLANGRGDKYIKVNLNQELKGVSDVAVIPSGTYVVSTLGINNTSAPIVLRAGETAYITTGKAPTTYPASIGTSFKTTKCTGYLDQKNAFTPSLTRNCPVPDTNSPVYRALSDSCYNFVRNIYSCQDPNIDNSSAVNQLSTQCRDFIRAEYNYQSCVDRHRSDQDFYGNSWRIYLGKSEELWSATRENYYLYDEEGKLVDRIIY